MALVLTRSDVLSIIRMEDVIDAVERAHAEHASGRAAQPTRVTVGLSGTPSAILPMPAAIPALAAAGLKLLSIFPGNRQLGVPVLNAVVILVDTKTGRCDAVLEGGVLTAFRTAAASAVATKYLAREDSRVLGLVGAGIEARSHLDALRIVRPVDEVLVWSRTPETAERFAEDVGDRGVHVEIVPSAEDAVRPADIVCTLTPSKDPIVHGAWFRPGTHVNAVGTHWIDHREIDTEAVTRSRVVVDSREANEAECGDLMIPVSEGAIDRSHFADEIGQIIRGERAARSGDDEITMYQSVGVAIQDVATAKLLVDAARETGVGTEIALW
jgi:ornithine cyclodeaminase/alanine dehydrogenase